MTLFIWISLLISFVVALDVFAVTVFEPTVAEIVKNPDKFNQGQVIVQGKAISIQRALTVDGSPYTMFFLSDKSSTDKVVVEYFAGTLDIPEATLVTVEGLYLKKPSKDGFINWIQANYVKQ